MPTVKKSRPANLQLQLETPASPSSPSPSSFSPIQITSAKTCSTPDLIRFLDKIENINEVKVSHRERLPSGANASVSAVTVFFSEHKSTRTLVEKKGDGNKAVSVEREIMITNAIKNTTNFPNHLFALPIYYESSSTINTHYTCYRKLGDLKSNLLYIQDKLQSDDSSVLSYLFNISHQATIALDALHHSEFKDKKGISHTGIVHNDIKSDNIFLKENGDIELADFGCAYFKDTAAPQFATYLYSAPELWDNKAFCKKPIDNSDRADIWSLGATLRYILTNKLMAPSEEKPELEKILDFQNWGKNYSQHWTAQVTENRSIEEKSLSEQDLFNLLNEKLNMSSSTKESIKDKKDLLENLAWLMLAPISVRPNAKELKNIFDKLKPDFIIDGEPTRFVQQLLEAKTTASTPPSLKATDPHITEALLNIPKLSCALSR